MVHKVFQDHDREERESTVLWEIVVYLRPDPMKATCCNRSSRDHELGVPGVIRIDHHSSISLLAPQLYVSETVPDPETLQLARIYR